MLRLRRRAALVGAALLLLAVLPPSVFIGVNCFSTRDTDEGPSDEVRRLMAAIENYERTESSTYLTFPEWYIVYSTDELAAFIERDPPSQFPYFGSVAQFWTFYAGVCDATKGTYPFNLGNHLMLAVIGMSFSVENGLKGMYENTVGRLTEWTSSHDTEEDTFAHRTTAEYGRFMHTVPWYEFSFGDKLRELWQETPLWGPHPVRKWERRTVLSLEYGLKAVYASLIGMGTETVYAPVDLEIHAWIDNAPETLFENGVIRKVQAQGYQSYVVTIPRYETFTTTAIRLIENGVSFLDIAGNDQILVTAIAPTTWTPNTTGDTLLFSGPILTDPGRQRIGVGVAVSSLHATVLELRRAGVRIEHLYDY